MADAGTLRELFVLRGEAEELGALTPECRRHVLARTAELLGAAAGALILDGDAAPGRKGRILDSVTHNFDGVTRPAFQPLVEWGSAYHPLVARLFERQTGAVGEMFVETSRQTLTPRAWYDSPYYCDHVRSIGFDESIISTVGTGRVGMVQGFGFFRERGLAPFGDREKELLMLVELGLGPFIHRPVTQMVAASRLSPRERDVLAGLLDGLADKEIAARLGISRHTVNQRAKQVFRAFDVHSRAELLARCRARLP
jgi:DNA-binding CsgD family transcriptional regulator